MRALRFRLSDKQVHEPIDRHGLEARRVTANIHDLALAFGRKSHLQATTKFAFHHRQSLASAPWMSERIVDLNFGRAGAIAKLDTHGARVGAMHRIGVTARKGFVLGHYHLVAQRIDAVIRRGFILVVAAGDPAMQQRNGDDSDRNGARICIAIHLRHIRPH